MKNTANLLFKSSVLRVIHLVFNIVSSFVLMPLILNSLGDKMYGVWVLAGSFLSFFWLFDAGLGTATQRYVAKAVANNCEAEANEVVNTCLMLFIFLGFGVLLFSCLCAFVVPIFVADEADILILRKLIVVLGVNFALGLPMRVFYGALCAHMRFDILTTISLIKDFLRVAIIIYLIKADLINIWLLAYITVGTDILEYLLNYIVSTRVIKYLKVSYKSLNWNYLPMLFGYSWITLSIQVADRLRMYCQNFVISTFMGVEKVTLFSIAWRLIEYFRQGVYSATGIFMPVFSRLEGSSNLIELQRTFIFVTKICIYFTMLMAGCLFIFGERLIYLWVGDRFSEAYLILVILLGPCAVDFMQNPSIQLLYGISRHRIYLWMNLAEGLLNILGCVLLVNLYGLIGIAIGTALPMALFKIFIQPYSVCKEIKLSCSLYYLQSGCCIIKSGLILVFCDVLAKHLRVDSVVSLFAFSALVTIIYSTILLFTGFSREERRDIFGLANSIFRSEGAV